MLGDGSAAAVFIGGAVPTASISQVAASQDIFFVPFEPTAKARLIADYPFFHAASIPPNTYRGQSEEFEGLNVGSMHLITSTAHDADLIYRLTRALYQNGARVAEKHPAGRAINPQNVTRPTGTDFHPGAIRFYQEIGLWPRSTTDTAAR
jgi:TRAP transporter TAXI family solute receptor